MYLACKYALFALIAVGVNLLGQELSGRLYSGWLTIYVSMFVGTLAGLAVKYLLDKRFIFYHKSEKISEHGKLFFLYSCMGVVTTLVFWFTELGFQYAFETKFMRYTGAIIGLTIGYLIKYNLDKRFVFTTSSSR